MSELEAIALHLFTEKNKKKHPLLDNLEHRT